MLKLIRLIIFIANIPFGRLGKPEAIAETVAFLTMSESGFITGANLDVNGGQYMLSELLILPYIFRNLRCLAGCHLYVNVTID